MCTLVNTAPTEWSAAGECHCVGCQPAERDEPRVAIDGNPHLMGFAGARSRVRVHIRDIAAGWAWCAHTRASPRPEFGFQCAPVHAPEARACRGFSMRHARALATATAAVRWHVASERALTP
jgi:hypothetical protein